MLAPSAREPRGAATVELSAQTVESPQHVRCDICGAIFSNLLAAMIHSEIRHPNRERGRGGVT